MCQEKVVDLRYYPFFELKEGDVVEMFINGVSRFVCVPQKDCSLYNLVFSFSESDSEDEESLPF